MPTFALKHIEEIKGIMKFYHLEVDGKVQFLEMEEELVRVGGYESDLRKISVRMQQVAEGLSLPRTKFKDITPRKETVKEYEIKTDDLRCYLFHDKANGRVVVFLGKKTTQKKDIKRFRNIKSQYFNQ